MFKHIFTILIAMLLVAGCGESFRSNTEINDSTQEESDYWEDLWGVDNYTEGETTYSKDHEIYLKYEDEINANKAGTMQVGKAIQAFDINLRLDEDDSTIYKVDWVVTLSCKKSFHTTKNIKKTELHNGKRVSLGEDDGASVRMECTDSQCNELVAAISASDGFSAAMVLVGMRSAGIVGDEDDEDRARVYKTRLVKHDFFGHYPTGGYYRDEMNCPSDAGSDLLNAIFNFGVKKATDYISGGF